MTVTHHPDLGSRNGSAGLASQVRQMLDRSEVVYVREKVLRQSPKCLAQGFGIMSAEEYARACRTERGHYAVTMLDYRPYSREYIYGLLNA